MASRAVEQILRQIEALDPSDRAELRRRLDGAGDEPAASAHQEREAEDEFQRHLLAKGLILNIPDRDADFETFPLPPLIEVTGEPISETIIRERR